MSPRPRIKICGITRAVDAQTALSFGADFVGMIGFAQSPRYIEPDAMADLLTGIPPGKRVVVDVAPDPNRVAAYRDLGFDAFQFHFDLSVSLAQLAAWSEIVGIHRLWLAPRMPPLVTAFPQILLEYADTFLIDAWSDKLFGGSGHTGNWQRFLDWSVLYQHKEWILAGGLNSHNVIAACQASQARILDVNSGVEVQPGIKDPVRIAALFEALRAL
jgi:phosphoribosylanthranilate isomerase